jgi:fructosamine-3-kinase
MDLSFLKLNDGNLKDMFEKELKAFSYCIKPKPLKFRKPFFQGSFENKIFLVTEFIQKGNPSENFWQTFAQQLAALHKNLYTQLDYQNRNYIGSLHQQNNFCNTWNEFYASQRIMPLIELAFNQRKCSREDLRLAENLCKRLYDLFLRNNLL